MTEQFIITALCPHCKKNITFILTPQLIHDMNEALKVAREKKRQRLIQEALKGFRIGGLA